MQKNNYDYSENSYMAHTPPGAPLYSICKKPGEVQMIWTSDRAFCTSLKDELDRFYIKTVDGWAIYAANDHDDPEFIDKFYLQDDGDSGTVVLKRERK
jgi:hypothetical protein